MQFWAKIGIDDPERYMPVMEIFLSHRRLNQGIGKLHVFEKTAAKSSSFKIAENNFKKSLSSEFCRWPLQVFFNILDLAGINAWILYKQTTGENISRQDFLLKLAVELGADFREAREQPKQRKNTKGSLPKSSTDAYEHIIVPVITTSPEDSSVKYIVRLRHSITDSLSCLPSVALNRHMLQIIYERFQSYGIVFAVRRLCIAEYFRH
ncbi:uncharacterized protein TNCV_4766221 [Trichonephila clavipes]|nr:uncharacterized protein TNCV_4766221 [Trichonephila clavipes]